MLVYIPLLFQIGALLCCFIAIILVVVHYSKEDKTKTVGTLKVATDEDGMDYMFLEVDKGKLATIKSSDKILLRVKQVTDE